MASQIAALEQDRAQYQEQLDVVQAGLKDEPGNAELKNLQAELTEMISMLNESIAELRPTQAPKPAAPQKAQEPPAPPAEPEKWSRENHPAFKKATASPAQSTPPPTEKAEAVAPANYRVNDTVLAKWVSGDRSFYPARITSITGSHTDPVYIVKFKTYDNTETLRARDIRPVSNKRKADDGTPGSSGGSAAASGAGSTPPTVGSSASGTPNPHTSDGVVTSASASMYPDQQARLEAEKRAAAEAQAAKPPKAKKIKATKELEKGKTKWQEFSAKSKYGKSHKKDSMFRTPEGVHGRVGFTGSGQAMRKDPSRNRHVYQQNDDLD